MGRLGTGWFRIASSHGWHLASYWLGQWDSGPNDFSFFRRLAWACSHGDWTDFQEVEMHMASWSLLGIGTLSFLPYSIGHTAQPSCHVSRTTQGCGYQKLGIIQGHFRVWLHNHYYSCADGALPITKVFHSYCKHDGGIFEQWSVWANEQNFRPPTMYLVTSTLMQ